MRKILITALTTLVMSYIVKGIVIDSLLTAVLFAIVLGLVNGTIGRLLKGLGCLLSFLSFGLFNLIINGAMVLLAARFLSGIHIDGLLTGILLSIVISIVSTVTEPDLKKE